jgi:hypothetical protein
MPPEKNFFLGFGERLTQPVFINSGGQNKQNPYSHDEAISRLTPRVRTLTEYFSQLPDLACPTGAAVGIFVMHPEWIAKSYFPRSLLGEYGLQAIGSKPAEVQPKSWTRSTAPVASPTTQIFVSGQKREFSRLLTSLENSSIRSTDDITHIEDIRAPRVSDRLRSINLEDSPSSEELTYEIALHAAVGSEQDSIIRGFTEYGASLGAEVLEARRINAGGLCFMPVRATSSQIAQLAQYSFLRVARPMPSLRTLHPVERAIPLPLTEPCLLPEEGAVDPQLRVAVFDGGIEEDNPLSKWVQAHEVANIGPRVADALAHGFHVTSALLFGPLEPGMPADTPYAMVDHFRVLDSNSEEDPYELYDVLQRILSVLQQSKYEFVNLSLGPYIPIEDDEVHAWTAVLDEYLSDGQTLASIAVGNTGHLDQDSGNSRVQVPSDCVNALSVGAASSVGGDWSRSNYSSLGPGRSPGLIKPDVLAFGGSNREMFHVFSPDSAPKTVGIKGTSFASPSALRLALGVRAHFGDRISPLALKALLIHSAKNKGMDSSEVGWGRVPYGIEDIVTCDPGVVRIIYQGKLDPAKYLRAPIPLPREYELQGTVNLSATFCFSSPVDPQDPSNYTRAGLDIIFRPHSEKFQDDSPIPKRDWFFQASQYWGESELRRDAHKWETTLHRERNKRGKSLKEPAFDIHYNARSGGGVASGAERIPYALVVTVKSEKTPDLYDEVVRSYAGYLEAMQPVIDLPIQISSQ